MNNSEIIEIARKIIGNKMELDYFSRAQGTMMFRQDRDRLDLSAIDALQKHLLTAGIHSQLHVMRNEYLLRLIPEESLAKKEKIKINILLFAATIITTTLTGAFLIFRNPFENPEDWIHGLPYAFAILSILMSHEMGHYLYAIKYRIRTTLPYFLPFFVPFFSFGTFGAFIKLKSPIPNKKALFDVGIAGPIFGFVISLVFLFWGFAILPDEQGMIAYITQMHPWSPDGEGALTLGNSLLFNAIRHVMNADYLPMYEIYHFPFIFAGWAGFLVTALNLIPIGQLDGGHITYALFGEKARYIAYFAFGILVILNFYSTNWLLWTVLILVLIRFKHPPTLDDTTELDPKQKILGWCSYLILITCFSPTPIYFSGAGF